MRSPRRLLDDYVDGRLRAVIAEQIGDLDAARRVTLGADDVLLVQVPGGLPSQAIEDLAQRVGRLVGKDRVIVFDPSIRVGAVHKDAPREHVPRWIGETNGHAR